MIRFSSLARPVALIALGMCCGLSPAVAEPSVKGVLKTYADIAQAGYADSLATAKTMRLAIDQLLSRPTEQNLIAARAAWPRRHAYAETVFGFQGASIGAHVLHSTFRIARDAERRGEVGSGIESRGRYRNRQPGKAFARS